MECPRESAILSFLCGDMKEEAGGLLERHIDECAYCRTLLSALSDVTVTGVTCDAAGGEPADAKDEGIVVEDTFASWAPGTVIGNRFEIEGFARSGGMGAVFRARDATTGVIVAIKAMKAVGRADEDRFEREAHLLMSLQDPGIVRYVAHGVTQEGKLYLAMEWLEGEDLAARLARGNLTVSESVILVTRVATALSSAHAVGIVHRDVKPSNLFLEGCDLERPRVLDFGIARSMQRPQPNAAHTRTGMILGTPGYIAPEQARGRRVDARADVFALGCVLYECLTGRRAFAGSDPMERLAKALLHDPPPPSELAPGIAKALDDLTARMLAKDPTARPLNCDEVAKELAQAPMLRPATERPKSGEPASRRRSGRRGWIIAASLALAVPLGTMLLWRGSLAPASGSAGLAALPSNPELARPAAPPEPTTPATSAMTATEVAVAAPLSGRLPQRAGPSHRGGGGARAAPLAPSSPARPPRNCHPPYVVDAAGFKTYKRECMD